MRGYEASTRGVLVRVRPVYKENQSDPAAGRYTWPLQLAVRPLANP